MRAAFYIDGFNLYHAIDDIGEAHLKWLNIKGLAETLIPMQSETLVRIVYCTAVRSDNVDKMTRQRGYLKALKSVGVECLLGHFATENRSCHQCRSTWSAPVEKQGDINLAISLIDDAHSDVIDHAYLVTSDGDQAATVGLFKQSFPRKKITTVSPPRRSHSKMILKNADAKIAINYGHIESNLFPRAVMTADQSAVLAMRPKEYDPPAGWVSPDQRPSQ